MINWFTGQQSLFLNQEDPILNELSKRAFDNILEICFGLIILVIDCLLFILLHEKLHY